MYDTDPRCTSDFVFADSNTEAQISAILSGEYPFPMSGKTALCFYGTYGTGKTTYSRIFCAEFEEAQAGEALAMEPHFVACDKTTSIDAILKRCQSIRSVIALNASSYHYFIFDEVDNLTEQAQRALKSFLNNTNIVCVLTTNYLDRVDEGLLNRCLTVNFNAADTAALRVRVQKILSQNGLPMLTDGEIDAVVARSDGAWREIVPTAIFLAKQKSHSKPPKSGGRLTVVK